MGRFLAENVLLLPFFTYKIQLNTTSINPSEDGLLYYFRCINMRTRIIGIIVTMVLVIGLCIVASMQVTAAGSTWYVDDSGNDGTGDGSSGNPWATIQHAIDTATAGDTVYVNDGNYTENVTVNKALAIQSVNGASVTTITAANNTLNVFNITADNISISGFTISGATGGSAAGIRLSGTDIDQVTGCTISNNICSINNDGIYLYYADNNVVSANTCSSSIRAGMYFMSSNQNTVVGNTCSNNTNYGIYFNLSTYNTVSSNTCNANLSGIYMASAAENNSISGNTCNSNTNYGINLNSVNDNNISLNTCANNTIYGIYLQSSEDNFVSQNNCGTNTNS
jgi:parallel beta-helix repeat protein